MGPKLGERMSIFYFYGTRSWAFALSIFKVVVLILIGDEDNFDPIVEVFGA